MSPAVCQAGDKQQQVKTDFCEKCEWCKGRLNMPVSDHNHVKTTVGGAKGTGKVDGITSSGNPMIA